MGVELFAVAAGVAGGAMALGGLYELARRKAARTGERAWVLFTRCLALFSVVHGFGLCLVTPAVLLVVPLLVGPLPPEDSAWMWRFVPAGVGFVAVGGLGVYFTRPGKRRRGAAATPR